MSLIPIRKICDNSHKHCYEIVKMANDYQTLITQKYFDNFMILIGSLRYMSCLSYNNKKVAEIKRFILFNSEKFHINYWDPIISFMSDDELYQMILNQEKLKPNILDELKKTNINSLNSYRISKISFINSLIIGQVKIKSFSYILMSLSLNEFINFVENIQKNFSSLIEEVIIKYINKNQEELTNIFKNNKTLSLKIFNIFELKPAILISIYPLIKNSISEEHKKNNFNKIISTLDKNLIIQMLEKKDFIPDVSTIEKIVEKSYVNPNGSLNSKLISEIVDILCEYGLKINKEIVIKMLAHGCFINNIEKHGIVIDIEILNKCSDFSYYPYKFDIVPTTNILLKECLKRDNLNILRKLKEFGGNYTTECLEIACSVPRNGKVIKYLINDCGVRVSDKCLEEYQTTYKLETLDIIMKKYKSQSFVDKSNENKNKNIEIDEKATMTVLPRNIEINHSDKSIKYKLKNKILKFFNFKNKNIEYIELHRIFLNYLIKNKLVIGKYFIINIELSNLLKINHCVIMDINQIHNILTYFIDEN